MKSSVRENSTGVITRILRKKVMETVWVLMKEHGAKFILDCVKNCYGDATEAELTVHASSAAARDTAHTDRRARTLL